ncbi:MAG TPA: ECF-type sigma factor [Isosphaeraceae bacterium]|nr:ECF-type sigma factor [Isosphaeraceae bacterium]
MVAIARPPAVLGSAQDLDFKRPIVPTYLRRVHLGKILTRAWQGRARAALSADGEGSVTRWIGNLKGGDAHAAQELWRRCFEALVRLARGRLRNDPRAVACV